MQCNTMRARAYPRIKPNPQRYQFSEEPEIYLRCIVLLYYYYYYYYYYYHHHHPAN
jgi:hypothetical protein